MTHDEFIETKWFDGYWDVPDHGLVYCSALWRYIDPEEYYLLYVDRPKCRCGCGKSTKFISPRYGYDSTSSPECLKLVQSMMMSDRNNENWKSDEYRNYISECAKNQWKDQNFIDLHTNMNKDRWNNPEYRKMIKSCRFSECESIYFYLFSTEEFIKFGVTKNVSDRAYALKIPESCLVTKLRGSVSSMIDLEDLVLEKFKSYQLDLGTEYLNPDIKLDVIKYIKEITE